MTDSAGPGSSWTSDHPTQPSPTASRPLAHTRPGAWQAVAASVVAIGLGAVAAVMLVVGHHPWDGRVVFTVFGTHGLHRGDILSVGPALAGTALAAWCLRQARH